MSNTEMIDTVELRELRAVGGGMATPDRPPLASIMSRGRAHQRRRRQSAAAVASAVGVATGATLAFGSGTSVPVHSAGGAPRHTATLFTARTAAYTIVSHADGTATFTIDPSELFDPATLQQDFARAGVPALVTMGEFCTSDPAPAGFSQVASFATTSNAGPDQPDAGGTSTITIDPRAMPTGAELSFGDVPIHDAVYAGIRLVSMALIDKQTHTCSSTAATDSPTESQTHQLRFVGIPSESGAH